MNRAAPGLQAIDRIGLLCAVLAAVANGQLAPGQGSQLLSGIATMARVVEIDELADRVAKLEQQHGKS